jgi:hypothetical protein
MNRAAFAFAAAAVVLALPRVALADEPAAAAPPAPATAPATSPAAATAPPPVATTGPVVELSADDTRATIERRAATTSPAGFPLVETGLFSVGHWEHACVAPCQLRLDPRFSYRVNGDGLVPTDSFALPRGPERVRVDAKMGSSTGRAVGIMATAGGVLAIAAGGLALVASPVLESEDVGSKGFRTAVLAGGIGAVSVGVVSATVGLFLWLTNGSSAKATGQSSSNVASAKK